MPPVSNGLRNYNRGETTNDMGKTNTTSKNREKNTGFPTSGMRSPVSASFVQIELPQYTKNAGKTILNLGQVGERTPPRNYPIMAQNGTKTRGLCQKGKPWEGKQRSKERPCRATCLEGSTIPTRKKLSSCNKRNRRLTFSARIM